MSGENRDQSADQEALKLSAFVRSAQKGETSALGGIIDITQRRLFKFAFMLCSNTQTAEDLCQDTYLKAFSSLSTLADPNKAMAWLYRILKNLAIDRFRLSSTKNETATENLDLFTDVSGADKETLLYVRELMQTLEPDDRTLVLLVHLEEYTYREAAELLGLTEDAVRLRLHRARKSLLEKYEKDETKRAPRPSKQ